MATPCVSSMEIISFDGFLVQDIAEIANAFVGKFDFLKKAVPNF